MDFDFLATRLAGTARWRGTSPWAREGPAFQGLLDEPFPGARLHGNG